MKQVLYSRYFRLVLPLLALSCWSNLMAKEKQQVQAPIARVHVFKTQALVHRTIQVELEAGVHQLVVEQVSPYIVNHHVEAIAESGKVLAVQLLNNYLNEKGKLPAVQELEDSIQQVQTALNELTADLESIQMQKEVLMSNKVIGGAQTGLKADELEDVLLVFHKKMAEFKTEISQINQSKARLTTLLEKLNLQLNAVQEGDVALHNEILITLEVSGPLALRNIEVQYLVDHVSWRPLYDISIAQATAPAQFVLNAAISQSSGENWDAVRLQLATNDPVVGMEKPELSTLYAGYYNPVPMPKLSMAYRSDQPMAASNERSINEDVQLVQNEIALTFEISGLQTILSDNKPYTVQLKQFQLPVELSYAAVPKLSEAVYVLAKLPMDEMLAQLNAEAKIYYNNLYSGTVYIQPTPNDSLVLTLGKDQRLSCKRTKVKEFSSKSFFGGTKTESSKYELLIHNGAAQSIQLKIEDQIPVSTDKEIAVVLKESGAAQVEAEQGKLSWQLNLKPNETMKLNFSFDVSYPSNRQLNPF